MGAGAAGPGLPKVLLVEDDSALVEGLRGALDGQGFVFRAETDATNALQAVSEFDPDVVLLDVAMPDVSGWEILTSLRAQSATRTLPVIMLTAASTQPAKVKGFNLGADDYVTKPFNVQELRCRIQAVLKRTRFGEAGGLRGAFAISDDEMGTWLLPAQDVYFVTGERNFTYLHTFDARVMSRLSLGVVESKGLDGFMRVHRSYVVNLRRVKGCGWKDRSTYRLHMDDRAGTEIPVSRSLVAEVQKRLGIK